MNVSIDELIVSLDMSGDRAAALVRLEPDPERRARIIDMIDHYERTGEVRVVDDGFAAQIDAAFDATPPPDP